MGRFSGNHKGVQMGKRRKHAVSADNRLRGLIATADIRSAAVGVYEARTGTYRNRLVQLARLISFQPRGRRVACSPPTSLGALAPIIVQPGASLADDVDWAIAQLMVLPLKK